METTTAAPRLYSVDNAGRMLGVKRTTVYRLIEAGTLRTVKIGRRRLVTADSLNAYVDSLIADTTRTA